MAPTYVASFKAVYLCLRSSPRSMPVARSYCPSCSPSYSTFFFSLPYECWSELHVPRMPASALLLISLLFGTIVAFVTGMSGPAASWAAKLPEGVPRLQEHLSFLQAPIEVVRQFWQHAQGYVSGASQSTGGASQAPAFGAGLFAELVLWHKRLRRRFLRDNSRTFFPAAFGGSHFCVVSSRSCHLSDKRQAVEIS